MISRKELTETLSLSCIESYFLAWLAKYYDITKLYGHSFIPLKRVFTDFVGGARYENYRGVPRIQDRAEDCGITAHEFYPLPERSAWTGEEALKYVRTADENNLCLIRVNEKFFDDSKLRAWRDDHYICVDKNLHWANQYPLSEGNFSEERFKEIFGGAVCAYFCNDTTKEMPDDNKEGIKNQKDFEINCSLTLMQLESAVGIMRMTRARMSEYYAEQLKVSELYKAEVNILNKMYFDIHRKLLRQGNELIDVSGIIEELSAIERKIAEEIV